MILLNVVLLIPSGTNTATANSSVTANVNYASGDTLKALGMLVEKNKISNNPLSIKYAKMALAIALQTKSKPDLVDAYKWIGKAYLQNQKDSSYFYYNLALRLADSCHLVYQKIHIFYNLASFYSAAYNYETAISLLDSSIVLAKAVKDPEGIANAYIALGNIKTNIQDYESARQMFELALKAAQNDTMYKQIGVAMGNLARKPFEMDVQKSIALEKEALQYLSKVNGVEEEMAYIYINIGNQHVNPDSALFYYKLALKLAVNANLPKILFGAYNNMAYSYLDKKDVQKAESCLRDLAIPAALEMNDNDWLSSLYDTYADVCVQKGDYKKAWEFEKKAMKRRDLDNLKKGSDQVRLLDALLELKSKELIIQNEEKELLVQRNRLQQTELWLAIALLLVVASVFTTLILQQRNRVKFQREQIGSAKRIIEMEETEKGRTARELHDLTGQLVLGISGTIENIDFPDPEIKELIKARIKELGASIRQISHRMNRAMIEHFTFSEMITGLCEDMQKLSRMKIDLDIPEELSDLPNELVLHFYRITQELLTNAGKYARDSQVKIRIYTENGKLVLLYSDNGSGFTLGEKSKPSMGVLNIFERAKLVGGQANLTTAPGKGTSWEIIFPVAQKNIIKS
ncbi:MAG: tetratricopeptide repeat protein [Bacteroidetes bacterium]|nr:tetratricopeptide repeat protein [Bacteroidota bacterium]